MLTWLLLASMALDGHLPDPIALYLMPFLRPCILALAVEDEILDPRECRYTLTNEPLADLKRLQEKRRTYAHFPRLHEGDHLPTAEQIQLRTRLAAAVQYEITNRQAMGMIEPHLLLAMKKETERLQTFWGYAYDVRCPYYYVCVKREALAKLVQMLGEERFFRGDWPDPVPFRHFQRIP